VAVDSRHSIALLQVGSGFHTAALSASLFSVLCLQYRGNNFLELHRIEGFAVLTAASMNMAVFWVVAPCSLVEIYRRFRGGRLLSASMYSSDMNVTFVLS
jgi:hypothetical protein